MTPFQTSRSEQEIFDDLDILCGSPGYIHVLANLSLRDNLIAYDGRITSEHMAASYAPERTVRTEFSTPMGLMLKHPIDFSLPAPPAMQALIDKTESLLKELHACLNQPMLEAFKRVIAAEKAELPVDEASPFLRGDVLRDPSHLTALMGTAYRDQFAPSAADQMLKLATPRGEVEK